MAHNDNTAPTPPDLVVLGDLVADILLPVSSLPLRAGEHGWADGLYTELGGSCTTLVAARRMGLAVTALGVVGGDDYGRQLLEMLSDEGVNVAHVPKPQGRQTVLCVVITDKAGQHLYLGIKDDKPPEPLPAAWRDVVQQARAIFTTGYTLRDMLEAQEILAMLETARSAQVPVFFDPGPSITFIAPDLLERAIALANVLLLTAEEAQHITEAQGAAAARELRARGPDAVVLKLGADGCLVAHESGTVHHPGFEVEVVDTVGAGDSFVAAFIAAYLRGDDWRACAALANAMGAAVAAIQGAGRSVPPLSRILQILGDHSYSAPQRP